MAPVAQAYQWLADLTTIPDPAPSSWYFEDLVAAGEDLVYFVWTDISSYPYVGHVDLLDVSGDAPVVLDSGTTQRAIRIFKNNAGQMATWTGYLDDATHPYTAPIYYVTNDGATLTVTALDVEAPDDTIWPQAPDIALSQDGTELIMGALVYNGSGYTGHAWGSSTADGTVVWSTTYTAPTYVDARPCVESPQAGELLAYFNYADDSRDVLLIDSTGIADTLALPTGAEYYYLNDPLQWVQLGGGSVAWFLIPDGASPDVNYQAITSSGGALTAATAEQTLVTTWPTTDPDEVNIDAWAGQVAVFPRGYDLTTGEYDAYWVDPLSTGVYASQAGTMTELLYATRVKIAAPGLLTSMRTNSRWLSPTEIVVDAEKWHGTVATRSYLRQRQSPRLATNNRFRLGTSQLRQRQRFR